MSHDEPPGTVNITIKKMEVVANEPDDFVGRLVDAIGKEVRMPSQGLGVGFEGPPWYACLHRNIEAAAIEEMRVRAAAVRVGREPRGMKP